MKRYLLHRTPALLKPVVHLLNKLILGELNQNLTANILTGAMCRGIPGVLWFLTACFLLIFLMMFHFQKYWWDMVSYDLKSVKEQEN